MIEQLIGRFIHIRGIVQGVGFRPLIYNYAHEFTLTGWILNSSRGVEIEIHGKSDSVYRFIQKIKSFPPVRARIDTFSEAEIPYRQYSDFLIKESQELPSGFLPLSPDLAVCPECITELFDSANRRYRYPFINCVNCGPRFTIIRSIPYDRPRTTMSEFMMCPDCQAEYDDPSNRRFHAQPIACPICGPAAQFIIGHDVCSDGEDAIQQARQLLVKGGILAIKSLGGFQLACDAFNLYALTSLRNRKNRIQKPFALMASEISVINDLCEINQSESDLLNSTQSPIVILQKKINASLPDEIAPSQNSLGFMLPYTPLHHLLMEASRDFPRVLVMTSGNFSEEPIAYKDTDALDLLKNLADGFLTHNRPVHMRTDDSVVKVFRGVAYPIRRARGYAPDPIQIPEITSRVFAAGSDLKNTFCFARNNYAFVSHHIGDLENYETFMSYESAYTHFEDLFNTHPQLIACDLHPEYFSSQFARDLACRNKLPIAEIQHHHAHLASCLIDNGYFQGPVIGLIFDGTGYGTDGNIWGGEILVGDCSDYERAYHLEYFRLPGGDAATHQVSRIGFAYLLQSNVDADELQAEDLLPCDQREIIIKQVHQGINAPYTSSMGRLFDAVASVLGICKKATYEGQAAIELEMIADRTETGRYDMPFESGCIRIGSLIRSIQLDLVNGSSPSKISMKFHNSLVQMAADICIEIRNERNLMHVALSGGVWQNRLLLEKSAEVLSNNGFSVFCHHQVPANDGGLSLGQAVIAVNRMK